MKRREAKRIVNRAVKAMRKAVKGLKCGACGRVFA